jgi:hypothetical protein
MVDVILVPFVAALVPFTLAPPDAFIDTTSVPPPASCATYSIEGSLDGTPSPQTGDVSVPQLEISATAYLHDGGEPLVGHRVIAVFETGEGFAPIDPVEMVTDSDGRVSILLPVGAIGVSFRSESAAIGDCPDVAPGDVPVVVVDLPLLPPGFGDGTAGVDDPPGTEPAAASLPVTGPRDGLILVAGLLLAIGLGTMATRVHRSAEEQRGISR